MSIKKIFSSDKNRLFQAPEYDYINNIEKDPSSKNILKKTGGNIIYKDYSNYTLPNRNSEKSTNNSTAYNFESKINELECKIIALEDKNELLLNRINKTEQEYEIKIRKLEKNSFEDKNNIMKAEQALELLNQSNNSNSNELKNKLNLLHISLQKEEESKNEQRQLDLELQKSILNKITEKLGETVKAEVDARFKADMENKMENQNVYKNIENDINKLKKEIEEINKQVISEIKISKTDCSERAHNLSKYIDQKLLEAVVGKNDSIDKVKKWIDEVISQIRDNIAFQNQQNKLFDERLKDTEIHVQKSKNDNFGYMSEVENRFDNKMKFLKTYFEINLQKHDNFMDETIKNMALTMDKNINFLMEQIIETRIKENEVYQKLIETNDNKFKSIMRDLEKICERVYQYENMLNVFDKQNDLLKKNIFDGLSMLKSRLDVHLVNEKILYTVENNLMQEQVTYLKKKLESSNADLIENLEKINKGSQDSVSLILLKLDKHEKMINSSDKINNDNFKKINDRTDENEVKQLMEQMLNNIENENLFSSLKDSKQSEINLNNTVKKLQEDIDKLNVETENNKKGNDELNEKIVGMTQMLNSSGNNISKAMDDIIRIQKQAKELEMRESVSKIMDVMLTNIENEITNEKMDNMSKFNLQQMTANITTIRNKLNSLSDSSDKNSTDISNLKESVESIKKRGLDQGGHNSCSIKLATNQMLNNVEFSNIYSLLKDGNKNSPVEFSEEMKTKFGELVDNKIQNELEKIKLDNQQLWNNAVELIQKVNKPGEIQEIINNVPPTILPINESSNRLLDVDYYNGKNTKPQVPDLDDKLKKLETEKDENLASSDVNQITNTEKEEDKNDKNDKKEKENDTDMVQIETNEKNSKNSKNSKGSKNSKNSKGSNNSKNSKGSKNSNNLNNNNNMQSNDNESNKEEEENDEGEEGEEEEEGEGEGEGEGEN